MARRVEFPFNGEVVEGEEVDFEAIREGWNEYACEDGTTVKIRTVVSKIVRLVGKKNDEGEQIYVCRSNNILSVTIPPQRKS